MDWGRQRRIYVWLHKTWNPRPIWVGETMDKTTSNEQLNFKMLFTMTLVVTDFLMTSIGIRAGIYQEANPLIKWLFELDFTPAFLFKLIFTAILLLVLKLLNDHHTQLSRTLMTITLCAYSAVCIFHYIALYNLVIFTFGWQIILHSCRRQPLATNLPQSPL